MSDFTSILGDDDVINTSESALMFQCTFKASEFLSIMESKLEEENLFKEGIECQILRPGQSWKTGKFRICLEFCSDEPEVEAEAKGGVPTSEYAPPTVPSESNTDLPPFVNQPTKSVGMWS
ncbi:MULTISPECIES: KGK domain-containing protein [Planktothrix]|jgi:KGK domain|uniref:KGK family protein n=1 Tax=Planktothrix rubescens CCAP 1459/22 TaxID=329571 RepID=A0A6J7ZT89_PLARU|nr:MULTISPECIES: KGK domain-containing protein [Planktothrix]CAD5914894.1 KGK family protein [Planktothrix rubescens]CAC5345871.1 KGK family protein [Planktothrix rubescens NIVA-CYA 18]CAD0230887.1 KGK family protein [Planktothrix agardhii]CAD5952272.1 KGK family protein [Planktothrix rubescens NIVA-CYA 18]CAD5953450.1 KGK family protein [Planktothrix agardhii]